MALTKNRTLLSILKSFFLSPKLNKKIVMKKITSIQNLPKNQIPVQANLFSPYTP